jgi:uncharacterized protein
MDFLTTLSTVISITYVGGTVYLANLDDIRGTKRGLLRWALFIIAGMTFLYGFMIVQTAMVGDLNLSAPSTAGVLPDDFQIPEISMAAAVLTFALAVAASFFSLRVIVSRETRQWIGRLPGVSTRYKPDSSVHMTAIVLAVVFVSITVSQFVLAGGLSGLADELEAQGVMLDALLLQAVFLVALAFLGVGLALRREAGDSLRRLGLRIPTRSDLLWGSGVGVGLLIVVIVMGIFWQLVVTPEEFERQIQASEEIGRLFNTLPLALVLSLSASISEEIMFRGAIQPVFGKYLTSALFVALHTQYTLTPATLLILVVSLGLGWLREGQSTTAAIIAHFIFNFIQLVVAGSSTP